MIGYLIIAALLAQAAAGPGAVEGPLISFSFAHDALVVVPVFLNGRGPYRFLLDTGATHSIVSRAVAKQLNIGTGKAESLISAGGVVPVTVQTVETIQIGGIRISNARIAVADVELLRALPVDGLLGADCLKQFKISIDYAHMLLSIEQ